MTAAPAIASAAGCWYGDVDHRPYMTSCPPACNGAPTHAERLGDGEARFYCDRHAHWRGGDIGRQRLRRLRVDEMV